MKPSGVWIWIWNLRNCDGGDLDAIAARVQAAGAAGVIVKSADSGHWFDQGQPVSAVVAGLRARGIGAATWSYVYGNDVAGEARMAIETLQGAQPDFHVLDVEQEVEDQPRPDLVMNGLLDVITAAVPGAPLCYSPLPIIDLHVRLPYLQATERGLPMLPQLYWTGLGWSMDATVSRFYHDVDVYGLGTQPIVPAYEDAPGVRPTDADLGAFLASIAAKGAQGCSVWSYEHLDASSWARVATAAQAFPAVTPQPAPAPVTPPTPGPTPTEMDADTKLKVITRAIGDPPDYHGDPAGIAALLAPYLPA